MSVCKLYYVSVKKEHKYFTVQLIKFGKFCVLEKHLLLIF